MGGRAHEKFNWTDERVEELKRLVDDRKSASDAAAHFGITRNAAIGKAIRIGHPFRSQGTVGRARTAKPPRQAKAKAESRAVPATVVKTASAGKSTGPGCFLTGEEDYFVRLDEAIGDIRQKPDPENTIRFADVRDGQCKWPLGDAALGPDMPVCGCDTKIAAGIAADNDFGEGHGLTWKRRTASLGRSFCPYHLRMAGQT